MNNYIEKLKNGENVTFKAHGTSMSPVIKNKQKVTLAPIEWYDCQVNDIVLCKVKGKNFLHFVKAKNLIHGVQIGNNRGYINGWTKTVFGKVI